MVCIALFLSNIRARSGRTVGGVSFQAPAGMRIAQSSTDVSRRSLFSFSNLLATACASPVNKHEPK